MFFVIEIGILDITASYCEEGTEILENRKGLSPKCIGIVKKKYARQNIGKPSHNP